MSVFVSYARPDEPHAERIAEGLRANGYEVWRDDQLPAHRAYSEVIEERLNTAKAVVVLWSDTQRNRSGCEQRPIAGAIVTCWFRQALTARYRRSPSTKSSARI